MKSIELSTMIPGYMLRLDEFEKKTFIRPVHRQFDFETGWKNILQISLYQKGPEVSEIGSTWLDNLINMNALRPFSPAALRALGGENAFHSAPRIKSIDGSTQVWCIPWLLDTRLVHYRRDLLAKAGVSENGAFATPEAMFDTLSRLQASGLKYPLAVSTGANSLHILASFLWGRGGDFRTPDLRKMALLEPESRRGMLDYFNMYRYMDPQHAHKTYGEIDPMYFNGEAAVLLSGQWGMQALKDRPNLAEIAQNTRYAPLPGVPYIGGTHLVTWRHSLQEEEAVKLIQYLTSPELYRQMIPTACIIPARKDGLSASPFANDPDYQLVTRLIQNGRRVNDGMMWAAVEMRLNTFCEQLWQDLFRNPTLNLEAEIERRTRDLSVMLERTLLSS